MIEVTSFREVRVIARVIRRRQRGRRRLEFGHQAGRARSLRLRREAIATRWETSRRFPWSSVRPRGYCPLRARAATARTSRALPRQARACFVTRLARGATVPRCAIATSGATTRWRARWRVSPPTRANPCASWISPLSLASPGESVITEWRASTQLFEICLVPQ